MDINASAERNDESWTDEHIYFERAIDKAYAGDEIWVPQGVYLPNAGGTPDRDDYFQMKNGMSACGGFNGSEPLREERDPDPYPTGFSRKIGDAGTDRDNLYRVFYLPSHGDASAILDRVTITGARAFCGHYDGMVIVGGSPILTNCIFRDNYSTTGSGFYNNGGSPVLINGQFQNNTAEDSGGGILLGGDISLS